MRHTFDTCSCFSLYLLEIYRIRAGEDEMIELSLHRRLKAHREAIGKVCTIGCEFDISFQFCNQRIIN